VRSACSWILIASLGGLAACGGKYSGKKNPTTEPERQQEHFEAGTLEPLALSWTQTFETMTGQVFLWDGIANSDGIYAVGRMEAFGEAQTTQFDAILYKWDIDGGLLYEQRIGTPGWEDSHGIALTEDGDVIVSGFTGGALSGTQSPEYVTTFVQKRSALDGALVWSHQSEEPQANRAYAVAVHQDETVLVASTVEKESVGSSHLDLRVEALSLESGLPLWSREWSTPENEYVSEIFGGNEEEPVLFGRTDRLVGDVQGSFLGVLGEDSSDEALWSYDGADTLDIAATRSPEGTFLVLGEHLADSEHDEGSGFFLAAIDKEGEELWNKRVGLDAITVASDVALSDDGSSVAVTGTIRTEEGSWPKLLTYEFENGEPQSSSTSPTNGNARLVLPAPDGGFFLVGEEIATAASPWGRVFVSRYER